MNESAWGIPGPEDEIAQEGDIVSWRCMCERCLTTDQAHVIQGALILPNPNDPFETEVGRRLVATGMAMVQIVGIYENTTSPPTYVLANHEFVALVEVQLLLLHHRPSRC